MFEKGAEIKVTTMWREAAELFGAASAIVLM